MSDTVYGFELPILEEIGTALYGASVAADDGHTRRHRTGAGRFARWLRRPLVLVIVLVGVSGSVGGLALAGTFGGTAISPQAWVSGQRVQPESATEADQSADLAILRRPRVASDALPGSASSWTNDPADGSSGANPALSRSAQGLPAGAAWLIPGDGMICFDARYPIAGGGGTCQDDATVDSGRVLIFGYNQSAPNLLGLAGIVPDGVDSVTVTAPDGTTQSVTVHENVYLAEIPLQPGTFSVAFNGPSGPVTLTANDPVVGSAKVTQVP
jgi:hypothetical protein